MILKNGSFETKLLTFSVRKQSHSWCSIFFSRLTNYLCILCVFFLYDLHLNKHTCKNKSLTSRGNTSKCKTNVKAIKKNKDQIWYENDTFVSILSDRLNKLNAYNSIEIIQIFLWRHTIIFFNNSIHQNHWNRLTYINRYKGV